MFIYNIYIYIENSEHTRENMQQSTTDRASQQDTDDICTSSDELNSGSLLQ